jgi:transposase
MRRTHLRRHANILKRLLVHIGGFNLGLLMRVFFGIGTPRSLQGRLVAFVVALWTHLVARRTVDRTLSDNDSSAFIPHDRFELLPIGASE